MVLMTMIGRLTDGLPLVASVHNDIRDDSTRNATDYQNQAKNLLHRLSSNSPSKLSIESDPCIFHCLIDRDVCYITLCEKSFPHKNAFAFLDALAQEFIAQYEQKIPLAPRPYQFMEFDIYIQKMKKQYTDNRTAREAMGRLRTDLRDIQNVMVTNIHDIMIHGENLTNLNRKATDLVSATRKYRDDAKYLNKTSSLTIIGLTVGSIVILCLIVYFFIL